MSDLIQVMLRVLGDEDVGEAEILSSMKKFTSLEKPPWKAMYELGFYPVLQRCIKLGTYETGAQNMINAAARGRCVPKGDETDTYLQLPLHLGKCELHQLTKILQMMVDLAEMYSKMGLGYCLPARTVAANRRTLRLQIAAHSRSAEPEDRHVLAIPVGYRAGDISGPETANRTAAPAAAQSELEDADLSGELRRRNWWKWVKKDLPGCWVAAASARGAASVPAAPAGAHVAATSSDDAQVTHSSPLSAESSRWVRQVHDLGLAAPRDGALTSTSGLFTIKAGMDPTSMWRAAALESGTPLVDGSSVTSPTP